MKSRYLYCLLFAGIALSASAQNKFSIDPMYALPLGKLNWTYKSSPGIGISYRHETDDRGIRPAFGATISYIQMMPNADSLYFIVDRGGVNGLVLGKVSYSKFSMFQLKVNYAYIIPISDSFNFNPGLSVGYLYGKRDYYYTDVFYLTTGSSEFIGWGLLSARTGFEFKMGDHFSLEPHCTYNFMVQLGSTDQGSIDYNEDTGAFYHFLSPGLSLNFIF